MADPWYQTLLLLLPHILLIPSIVLSYWKRLPIVFVQLLFTFTFSILYHVCKSTDVCLLGGSLLAWSQLDYIYAFGQILVVFILLALGTLSVYNTSRLQEEYGEEFAVKQLFWSTALILLLIGFDILVVLTRLQSLSTPLNQNTALIIIVISASAVVLKITLVDEGKFKFFSRYEGKYLLVGVLLLIPGLIFFLLDSSDLYWFYHSLWHTFAFASIFFLILGATKNTYPSSNMTKKTKREGMATISSSHQN